MRTILNDITRQVEEYRKRITMLVARIAEDTRVLTERVSTEGADVAEPTWLFMHVREPVETRDALRERLTRVRELETALEYAERRTRPWEAR